MSVTASQTAATLLAQYGDDAAVIAILRAAEYAAAGDMDACEHWEAVAALLDQDAGGHAPAGQNRH